MDDHDPVLGPVTAHAVLAPPEPAPPPESFDDLVIDLRDDPDAPMPDPAPRATSEAREAEAADAGATADADAVLETLDAELQDPAVAVVDELPAWPIGATGPAIEAVATEVRIAPREGDAAADPAADPTTDPETDPETDPAAEIEGVGVPAAASGVLDLLPVVVLPTPMAADVSPAAVVAWTPTGAGWEHEPAARWRTPQLVGAILCALLVGLGLGLVVGGRSGSAPEVGPPIAEIRTGSAAAASAVAASAGSPSPAARVSVADVAAVPLTGPGTFREPLPVGARATLRDAERGDLEIVVIGVDRDPWARLKATNEFNTPAPANLRYVMATVAVIYHAGSKDKVFDGVSGALALSAFGSAGREHRDAEYPVVAPQPLDRAADLLDGGSIYGNVVFAVEADSVKVSLRVQRTSCSSTCGEVWISLL